MEAKRFFAESCSDPDQPSEKRIRTRPSFASVIKEAVMVNSFQHFAVALEPLLRRVVTEEVERGLGRRLRTFTRSPSLRIQAPEPSGLQLIFTKEIPLQIFTGTKIIDAQNNPLQIILADKIGDRMVRTSLPYPIKVEIVVLDGDFSPGDHDTWTSEEFDKNIVRERTGKRPLLTGDLNVTLRDGLAPIGEIEFTDNSSWIRSRKFRIGARVAAGSGQDFRVREAMTEPFVVKDHRGELYKKHHPPNLDDEVWRLEKIGKDGAFHKKLRDAGINTVQDFLKLSVVDSNRLKKILGNGMSEKMWEVTITHAKTCIMGNKFYMFHNWHHNIIILNPICQVVQAEIEGKIYTHQDLISINDKACVEKLARDAYDNWNSLQEFERPPDETPLLTQGNVTEQYPNHHQMMGNSFQQHGYPTDNSTGVGYLQTSSARVGCSDWPATYPAVPIESSIRYNVIAELSSDDDLTPSKTFISGV